MAYDPLAALIAGLRGQAEMVGVQIEPGFPGDAVKDESLYAGEILESTEYGVYSSMTGRKHRFTEVTIPLELHIASKHRADECRQRLVDVLEAIESYVASDLVYDDEPLVLDHGIGQTRSFVLGTPNGHLGMANLTVTVNLSIP